MARGSESPEGFLFGSLRRRSDAVFSASSRTRDDSSYHEGWVEAEKVRAGVDGSDQGRYGHRVGPAHHAGRQGRKRTIRFVVRDRHVVPPGPCALDHRRARTASSATGSARISAGQHRKCLFGSAGQLPDPEVQRGRRPRRRAGQPAVGGSQAAKPAAGQAATKPPGRGPRRSGADPEQSGRGPAAPNGNSYCVARRKFSAPRLVCDRRDQSAGRRFRRNGRPPAGPVHAADVLRAHRASARPICLEGIWTAAADVAPAA